MANLLLFADDAVRIAAVGYGGGNQSDSDLDNYGTGKSYIRTQPQMRRTPFGNSWSGLRSTGAFLGGVPQIAFSSARVQRGEVLPTYLNSSIGLASYPALSAVISPVARFFLPIGGAVIAPAAASLLALFPAYGLGKAAASSVRYFKKWGYQLRHIEMGGNYEDTETAQGLRLRAVSEMSSALSYSRRWLGNEASFMR